MRTGTQTTRCAAFMSELPTRSGQVRAGGTSSGPSQLPSELGIKRVNMSYREGGESALTEEEEEW
jgi:hypothetical protein